METERLIERVRQMREKEADIIEVLEVERTEAESNIRDSQGELDEIDREIAERKAAIAEYQELIKRLEAI